MKNITTEQSRIGSGIGRRSHGRQKLGRGRVISMLCTSPGFSVHCLEGMLWITREGDPADHLLGIGGSWTASGPGMVVVEAVEDSALVILEPASVSLERELLKEWS